LRNIWSRYVIIYFTTLQNLKAYVCNTQALIICLSIFFSYVVNAQSLNKSSSKSYGVNEGLLSGHVLDVAEDANGFLWISTGVGLQRFDGNTFETVSIQDGLPQTSHISFFKLRNGNIWLSYENGISAYNITANKFKQVISFSKKFLALHQPKEKLSSTGAYLTPLLETDKGIWCRDGSQRKFTCINKTSGQVEDSLSVPDNMQPNTSIYTKGYNNTLLYTAVGFTLVEIDFNLKKIIHLYQAKGADQNASTCAPINKTDVIITSHDGISRVNMATGSTMFLTRYPKLGSKHIYNISLTPLQNSLFVLSLNNQLFTLNATNGKIVYQIVNQQNGFFVDPGYISNCLTDSYNHLWVISTAEGLKKINLNSPGIKYYGFGKLPQNFNRCIYADKKANIIITGSLFNGFSVFDTSQRLIKHFNLASDVETSCILKVQPYKYLLFATGHAGVYLLNSKTLQLTALSESAVSPFKSSDILYETYAQRLTDSTAILFCNLSYYIVNSSNNKIRFTKGTIPKEFSGAILDHKGRIWLGQTGKYFILTGKDFARETAFYLPEKVKIQCFMEDDEKNVWLGTEKGLYKLNAENGAIIAIYQKKDGLANDCIYSIVNDNNGNTWCGTNKGISGIYRSGKIINMHGSDGLQGDEFNTNSYAKAADNELFFGGINGVNSFYPDSIQKIATQPRILITNIQVMDAHWNSDSAFSIRKITLPYSENTISFSFTALGWYTPNEYNYQFKMTGIDKKWVNAGNSGYARYVLPPGNYIFNYTAGNEPARNLLYKKFISITITPPFWHTVWFIVLMAVLIILIVIGSVNFYYKTVNRKRLRQMEVQQTLQLERERISRDLHDNIGAYTTVLIAAVENMDQEVSPLSFKQCAQSVSDNAKNIMASLKETIWILNNDAITITDFIDRFKLYANKAGCNFSEAQISFKEKLVNNQVLSPSESLNLFRIMQETLQNAFKHANAKTITIFVHSDDTIYISIKDDGVGFDAGGNTPGNGLFNIKYRAKEAGYSLTIISTEQGTEITLQKNRAFAA
jgi:signal transduction histidine kinase/ligand-binding sensor domain-containing protein